MSARVQIVENAQWSDTDPVYSAQRLKAALDLIANKCKTLNLSIDDGDLAFEKSGYNGLSITWTYKG